MGPGGQGKKRIVALAKWHFDGGDAGEDYCRLSCGGEDRRCEACPYAKEEPQTDAGEVVWDCVARLGGQIRIGPQGTPFALDYAAALSLGQAMGADMGLLADVLPGVEGAILKRGVDVEGDFAEDSTD